MVRFSFDFFSFLICTESLFSPSSSRVRVRVLLNLSPFCSLLFHPIRVRVGILKILFPFLFSDPNKDLFFLAVSVRHFSRAVAVVTGVPVTSATPGPFLFLLPN